MQRQGIAAVHHRGIHHLLVIRQILLQAQGIADGPLQLFYCRMHFTARCRNSYYQDKGRRTDRHFTRPRYASSALPSFSEAALIFPDFLFRQLPAFQLCKIRNDIVSHIIYFFIHILLLIPGFLPPDSAISSFRGRSYYIRRFWEAPSPCLRFPHPDPV